MQFDYFDEPTTGPMLPMRTLAWVSFLSKVYNDPHRCYQIADTYHKYLSTNYPGLTVLYEVKHVFGGARIIMLTHTKRVDCIFCREEGIGFYRKLIGDYEAIIRHMEKADVESFDLDDYILK